MAEPHDLLVSIHLEDLPISSIALSESISWRTLRHEWIKSVLAPMTWHTGLLVSVHLEDLQIYPSIAVVLIVLNSRHEWVN